MNKKTILILILVIVVSGAGIWYFFRGNTTQTGQSSEETKKEFSANGTLNKDESAGGDGWVLNYENAGEPRKTAVLDFGWKTKCDAGAGQVSCSDVELKDGMKVGVIGKIDDNKVSISVLNILADAENKKVCAQVVTTAINPATGEQKDFPTPCDVPEGWGVMIK